MSEIPHGGCWHVKEGEPACPECAMGPAFYIDYSATEPELPAPTFKVGDRFMIDDVPVIVTAVLPKGEEDTKSFTIHLDQEELDGDESYPEEAALPFWNRGEVKE